MIMGFRFAQGVELGGHSGIVTVVQKWELIPLLRHQEAIDRIRSSIIPSGSNLACSCYHVSGVGIQFLDGSLRIPDISIFCRRPTEENGLVIAVPAAVIEVISEGFEAKDLKFGPPFYLSRGVKDVIVFDPNTLLVLHIRHDGVERLGSPVDISLECGCRCRI